MCIGFLAPTVYIYIYIYIYIYVCVCVCVCVCVLHCSLLSAVHQQIYKLARG